MENPKSNIQQLSDLYESAKDNLIRLTIKDGEHEMQTVIFEDLRKMRDLAATALQSQRDK